MRLYFPLPWLFVSLLLSSPGLSQESDVTRILDRRPTDWKLASPGAWSSWNVDQEPAEELRPFLARAVNAYMVGDLPASLTALFELLDEAPGFPSAMHQSGVIYFRLRRYGDAIVAFERYLETAPHRVEDTRALGHCYYTLGDYEKARDHYELVLELTPDSVEALRGYALTWMRLGDADRALKELRRLLELDGGHANAATWVAQILYDEEQVDEALEAALTARDLDPYEPRAWFLLSQIYFELERDEEAESANRRFRFLSQISQEIRAAEARLLYDPRQPAVYSRLIDLNRQAGNLMAVGLWLNRWMQVDPGRIGLHMAQLDLALEMGDGATAERLAENLRLKAGDDLAAWERLSQYYAKQRDRIRQSEAEAEAARLRARPPR